MSVILRDKTTSSNQMTVMSDGSTNTNPVQQEYTGGGRAKIGAENILLWEGFDGATLDFNKFTTSVSTMTIAQNIFAGTVTLNNGSSVLSGAYAILNSIKSFNLLVEYSLFYQVRARVVPQANTVIEYGFGTVATTGVPSDGVFFRWIGAQFALVINYNGTEVVYTCAQSPTFDPTQYYNYSFIIREKEVAFECDQTSASTSTTYPTGVAAIPDTYVPITLTTPTPWNSSRQVAFARVYNTGTAGTAAQLYIGNLNVNQLDVLMNRPWSSTVASMGRSFHQLPTVSGVQAQTFANSAAPASATLANTTAGYTTLGGLWQFVAVAGANTDYALFGYQIPAGYQFVCTGVIIEAWNTGAAVATTPSLLMFGIGVNASTVSLAVAESPPASWAPRRVAIGTISFPIGAVIGANGAQRIDCSFIDSPIICDAARFFHVILRMPIATATASQVIAGLVTVRGYFE